MDLLTKSGIRYLLKHPWQFILSVLGIAVGVALVVSIDTANHSTSRAFNISMNSVAGKSTHQITGTSGGIPDSVYRNLKLSGGTWKLAPVIESYVSINGNGRKICKLLGVDFFAERPFRDYLQQAGKSIDGELKTILTMPNSVFVSGQTLRELQAQTGDSLKAQINGSDITLVISGIIREDESSPALENLIIADISTAQELCGKTGAIDFIDVIAESDAELDQLRSMLPESYEIKKSGSRSQTAEQMLEAFNINLQSLSLLALIVGLFLIYNTMTFSVVRRRTVIGTMRSIGVTSGEVYRMILAEALLTGLIGTIAGIIAAYYASEYLLFYISQTINDLYFVVSVREVNISAGIIIKGIALGLLATVLSALKPAREASSVHPRTAMIRSEQESSLIVKVKKMNITGVVMIISGALILAAPSANVWLSYAGMLPVIAGFAMITPSAMMFAEKMLSPLLRSLFGITGKMASRAVIQNISRTYIAIAALSLAVAATVGVGTMINSFRNTVIEWLESRLNADLFISAPNLVSRRNDAVLPEELTEKIRNTEGVADLNFYREIELFQEGKRIHLISSGVSKRGFDGFRFKEGNPEDVWEQFRGGDIIVSEPFAFRNGLEKGSLLKLRTDNGMRDFRVAGIYYDYASDQGLAAIYHEHFKKHWTATGVSGISVYVTDAGLIDRVKERIQALDTGGQQLLVRSYRILRDSSIEIFDRTFLVAKVLQILSVVVAFIGILSSLMSLQLERRKELGTLRAIGLLPSQLFGMVILQTFAMGIIAGILALPLGSVLAAILVFIINKRSFGWTMQFELLPSIMIEALVFSVVAALLAGLYPAFRMSNTSPSNALREE